MGRVNRIKKIAREEEQVIKDQVFDFVGFVGTSKFPRLEILIFEFTMHPVE